MLPDRVLRACLFSLFLVAMTVEPAQAEATTPQSQVESVAESTQYEEGEDLETPRPERQWYGWQTLAADGAAAGLLLAGLGIDSIRDAEPWPAITIVASGFTYALAAPLVHESHGHSGKALGSLGLRVLGPIGAGLLSATLACTSGGDFCALLGLVVGVPMGMVGAIIVDAAVVSWEDAPRAARDVTAFRLGSIGFTPTLSVLPSGAQLGVVGRM